MIDIEKDCTACSGSSYYCGGPCGACNGTGKEYSEGELLEALKSEIKVLKEENKILRREVLDGVTAYDNLVALLQYKDEEITKQANSTK